MAPQTAQDWFTSNAPKTPATPSGGDWFSSNAPGNAPASTPPAAPATPARQPTAAEQQITQQTQNTPMESSWLRSPWEALKSTAQGLIVDPTVGFYNAAKQKDAEMGGPGGGNALLGAPELLYDSLRRGEDESRRLIHDKMLRGDPSWIQDVVPLISPQARGIADTAKDDPFRAAGQLGSFLAVPEVSKITGRVANGVMGAQPIEALRSATRDVLGAGPGKIAEAEGAAGDRAAAVTDRNAAATAKADLANQTDISKAQANYNEALAEHEGAGSEAQQEYQRARAEWEQENTEGPQKVQEQRAAEEAKQKQRQGFDEESNAHAKETGAALDQLQKDVEKDVKASWPKTPGVGDAERVATNMQRRAGAAMRESGPIPSPIARIIDRYTPEGGEGEFPEVQPDISASAYEQLKDEGVLTEDEIAAMEGTGKSPAEPNFDNLQSQYSAMGKMAARSARMGDRVTAGAYGAARDVLGEEMRKLTDAAGTTEQFDAATQKFKTMARTFYNKTAVSRAIAKYREIVGSLPDHSDPGGIAAPFVRQILASDPKVFETAKAQLSQFKGAPLDELEAMRSAHEQFKSMPSKAKIIPDYVPKPEPQPGEVGPPPVHEQPVPAHVADLTAPPEPFNRSEFIKGRLQHTADYLKHMTLRELPYSAVAAGGAGLEGHPLIAAGAASAPALTYGMARLLEHPGFQEWVSREPGAGLQPGSATPFNPPEPPPSQLGSVSPSAGPGPTRPAPVVPPPTAPAGATARAMGNTDIQIMRNGKPTTVQYNGQTLLDGVLKHHVTENGQHIMIPDSEFQQVGNINEPTSRGTGRGVQPPPMTSDFRESLRNLNPFADHATDTDARVELIKRGEYLDNPSPGALHGYLQHLGITIDPSILKGELHSELTDIFDELGNRPLKPTEIRKLKTALDMKNRPAYETAEKIRSDLRLGKR